MGAKDVLGKEGEQAAAGYLESCGFRILDRNWRCADGEIDIVAVERHTLVVCEVKTRSSDRRGTPLESVSRAKRNRLRRLAIRWLTAHGVRFDQVRVDIVGVTPGPAGGFTVEHRPQLLFVPPGQGWNPSRRPTALLRGREARQALVSAWAGDPHGIVRARPAQPR